MRLFNKLSSPLYTLIGLGLVAIIVLGLVANTLLGSRVSQVFSTINSGLSYPGGGGGYAAGAPQGGTAADVSNPLPAQSNLPAQERMIIRNAALSIEVANVTQAEEQIRTMVGQANGYILSSNTYGEGDSLRVDLTTRVPAEQFDATLSAFQALASKVRSRSVTGEDVTEEFVDLSARLHTLEGTRDRVEALLGQATKIDDILKINASLNDLQSQIEQIQGRMEYLSQNAAVSTIEVSINPVPVVPILSADSWQPVGIARGALHDVIAAGQGLVNLLIVSIIWLPLVGPPLLLAWWGWRRLRQRRRQPPPPPTQP